MGVFFLSGCVLKPDPKPVSEQSTSSVVTDSGVPLPTGRDAVNLFFTLINEKRIPEAVAMMSEVAAPDDATRQAWGVQFNAMQTVEIVSIEPWNEEGWSDKKELYQTTLKVQMSADSAQAVIPYYGFDGETNVRWIETGKDSQGVWKINGIYTGP